MVKKTKTRHSQSRYLAGSVVTNLTQLYEPFVTSQNVPFHFVCAKQAIFAKVEQPVGELMGHRLFLQWVLRDVRPLKENNKNIQKFLPMR